MNPLISIVVTCYNHQDYIEECLRSIFRQSYANIELLIFNDGSSDQSETIIQQLLPESPFEKTSFFSQSNMGVVKTRNRALEKITGAYLLFVDSDDFLEEEFVEKLYQTAVTDNADLVYTSLLNSESKQAIILARPFDLQALFVGNYISATSLIKTTILGEVRFDENMTQIEDYDFFLNLIVNQAAKTVPCYSTYLNYRVLESSRSARGDFLIFYKNYIYLLEKYQSHQPELVAYALNIHFDNNLSLMPTGQVLSIFYGNSPKAFYEEDVLYFPFKQEDKLVFSLPVNTTHLRLDLSELPSYYEKVQLVEKSTQTQVIPVGGNGLTVTDSYFFNQADPQLIFDLRHTAGREFELTYQLANVTDLMAENFLLKKLSQDAVDADVAKRQLSKTKRQLDQVSRERDELKKQVEDLVVRYNSVIHSRRWTIPTKIIDFFRRNK